MSQSAARIEPAGWIRRRLGVSWAELWIPEVTRREAPVEGRLRIQPLDTTERTLTVRFDLRIHGDRREASSSSSSMHSGEVVRQEVRLGGGWRVEIPFRVSFPIRHDDTWYGSVQACIQGVWPWDEAAVVIPFTLMPPPLLHTLARQIAEMTGCSEEEWSVSSTRTDDLTYFVKLRPAGEASPLPSEVELELREDSGQYHATIRVAEPAHRGVAWFRRPHFGFRFSAEEANPHLRDLWEFLRPWNTRLRSVPIPVDTSGHSAHSALPVPAGSAEEDRRDLPTPSREPDGE